MLMAGAITQTPTPPWDFSLQDITENGCAPTTEEQLPKTAPSPLVEAKDPKFREDRRPITVHFGQVCTWPLAWPGLSVVLADDIAHVNSFSFQLSLTKQKTPWSSAHCQSFTW